MGIDYIFKFRSVGILLHDGKVLVHKSQKGGFYAFPGGHVEPLENTESALKRELMEELEIDVKIIRLLSVNENFFELCGKKYQELAFYYLTECEEAAFYERGANFYGHEAESLLEFHWLPLAELENTTLYPMSVKKFLKDLPCNTMHIIEQD